MRNGKLSDYRAPSCRDCSCCYEYKDIVPTKKLGVNMHFGERFCTATKRAKRFGKRDPKNAVPAWYPKRKTPCELRVYCFKSTADWAMHTSMVQSVPTLSLPPAHRYAVEFDLHTQLTPLEFWKRCDSESDGHLLNVTVHRYHVVEIDDGLKPTFFYKTESGYQILPLFHAEIARNNRREDTD